MSKRFEVSASTLDELRSIVSLVIIPTLVYYNGHSVLNRLFETPDSFFFYYTSLPLVLIIPSLVLNLLYFKKYLHKSKLSIKLRYGLGLWLSLIIIMNIIPFSLSLLIEIPYHTHWPVEQGYYQWRDAFNLLEILFVLPVSIYNFHLWRKRVKLEWARLYQEKIPIFPRSKCN